MAKPTVPAHMVAWINRSDPIVQRLLMDTTMKLAIEGRFLKSSQEHAAMMRGATAGRATMEMAKLRAL